MEFATTAQQEVYERIGGWMRELFGTHVREVAELPAYVFQQDGTRVHVLVAPWGTNDATVTIRSRVVQDLEITPALTYHLLRENDLFRFGGFGLDSSNDVVVAHAIVGSTCDRAELEASVRAVADISDRYTTQLIPRFGGVTPADRLARKPGL